MKIMKNKKYVKKIMLSISIILLIALQTGCGNKNNNEDNTDIVTPTTKPIVTLPAEVTPGENTTVDETEDTTEETLSLLEYYPMKADTEYVYEGEGNEYASFVRYTDFLDEENGKIQTRTNNGGTETVRVIEIKDGKLSVISIINECYYRDNIMDDTKTVANANTTANTKTTTNANTTTITDDSAKEETEILLMEPLVKGTQWTLSDGRKRYISETEVKVETPSGSYKALEVTTESTDSNTKDYYAYGVGLVKTIFEAEDMEVSSSLSEINSDTPFTQVIDVFYPDADEKIYVEPVTLTFHTGDITRLILQETLKKEATKETYLPLASTNTKINSLYLGEDNIVYVDFSAEFVQEMNAGAGYELLILQSVTNTLGNYYGVQKVYITLEGKPYESGHVIMKKGETFEVNMDAVVR